MASASPSMMDPRTSLTGDSSRLRRFGDKISCMPTEGKLHSFPNVTYCSCVPKETLPHEAVNSVKVLQEPPQEKRTNALPEHESAWDRCLLTGRRQRPVISLYCRQRCPNTIEVPNFS